MKLIQTAGVYSAEYESLGTNLELALVNVSVRCGVTVHITNCVYASDSNDQLLP